MSEALASIEVDDLPVGLGGAKPVELPATMYRQGGRVHYHVALPVAQLTTILHRPDPTTPLQGNRKVDAGRAKKFGEYILKNEDWVSPAIIVRVPHGDVNYAKKADLNDGTSWGILSIPLDVLTEILLLDGQHRTLGVFIGLELINERIKKARETIRKMETQGLDQSLINKEKLRLEGDILIRRRMSEEHVSMDVAEVGDTQALQMFGDINNNAKGVNPDFTTILDQREVVNRIAVQVMESHVLLQDRVEIGQAARMSSANPNLIGAKALADIARSVLVGTGRVGTRVEDELQADMTGNVKKVEKFLDVLVNSFDELRDIVDGRIDPKDLRESSMLGSATMLRVLAAVYHDLTTTVPGGTVAKSRSEIEQFFRQLDPHLKRIPVSVDDRFWMDTKVFVEGGSAPLARQGSIKSLVNTMVEWAREGLPS